MSAAILSPLEKITLPATVDPRAASTLEGSELNHLDPQNSPPFNYCFASTEEHLSALNENPLYQIDKDLIDCGLGPVLPVAKLIYLVKASAYAGRHVSIQIRGASESCKSTTMAILARLHPDRDIIQRHSITHAALMEGLGCGGDLRRMTICLDENVESRKRDADVMATMRELTTKDRVTRSKMHKGQVCAITLLGPATVIDCMLTDTALSDQDVNRFLVIAMPEDAVVRSAICKLNAERFDERGAERREVTDKIAMGHKLFMAQLRKDITVNKPQILGPSNYSPRFDSIVFGLTCTAAWLQQRCRPVHNGLIEASIDDYEYVYQLLNHVRPLCPRAGSSCSAMKLLTRWRDLAQLDGNVPFTTPQLHEALAPDMDPAAFGRLVNELIKANYAQSTGRGPRGVKIQELTFQGLAYSDKDLFARLPTPTSLRTAQACASPRSEQSQS